MRNSSSLFTRVRFLQTARKQLENRHFKRAKFQALLLRAAVYLAAVITAGVLLFVVGYILIKGIPHLSWSLFEWRYNSENVSLMPALLITVIGHFNKALYKFRFQNFHNIYPPFLWFYVVCF